MKGQVIKKKANAFWVYAENQTFVCTAQKKMKTYGVFVGDFVEFDQQQKQILRLLPRKNKLLRPPLANLDALVILITSAPAPDFYLLDKMILFCKASGIEPIICHSKTDLESDWVEYLHRAYGKHFEIVEVSAHKGAGIDNLLALLQGKTCAFAGQSGVGKSALINAIVGNGAAVEGELSSKIERGKNTTRHTELFEIAHNTFLADTAGFSSLDETFLPINADELGRYYPEFVELAPKCKFSTCTHLHEPDCAIKKALESGEIDKGRYERYQTIYDNLKQSRK